MPNRDDIPTPIPREFAVNLIDRIHASDPGAVEAWAEDRDDVEVRVGSYTEDLDDGSA